MCCCMCLLLFLFRRFWGVGGFLCCCRLRANRQTLLHTARCFYLYVSKTSRHLHLKFASFGQLSTVTAQVKAFVVHIGRCSRSQCCCGPVDNLNTNRNVCRTCRQLQQRRRFHSLVYDDMGGCSCCAWPTHTCTPDPAEKCNRAVARRQPQRAPCTALAVRRARRIPPCRWQVPRHEPLS